MTFAVGTHGKTSAAVLRGVDAKSPRATLVFAHGAGAPRTHPFIVDLTTRIAARGIDVFAFNFLYADAGRKLPDKTPLLEECWRAAMARMTGPIFIGGKSMGGRMATHVVDERVKGVICVGYPLHPIGKPKVNRDEILAVDVPLLAVQGTRDELGTAAQLKRFVKAKPNIRVHAVRDGDHSLAVPKRSGRDAVAEAADAIAAFIDAAT